MRVVDLSADVAGRFATKLFALADVEVVRPAPADASALGLYLDARKRIAPPPDDGALRELLAGADLVFTSFDRGAYVGAAAHPAVRPLPAACVEVTTSTWGTTGPYSGWRGGPVAEWAAGGYLAITGWPDREPLLGPEHLCGYIGGYTAAIAAEAALHARRGGAPARRVDVSTAESMLSVHQSTFSRLAAGIVRVRTGRYTEVYPLVVRPCREGHVSLGVVTDAEFDRLAIAIGRADLAADERFGDAAARWEHRDALDEELHAFLGQRTADEVVAALRAGGIATAKVASAREVLDSEQLAHRGFWDRIDTPAGAFRAPGNPVPASRRPASGAGGSRSARLAEPAGALPLAGRVVLDFTTFWAGPSATRMLADLGARVIWVERPGSRPEPGPDADANERVMQFFHLKMNRGKQSAVIDLTTPAGRELARRLAREADVLVENFRPGVMDDFGLGPAQLCSQNPGLVYVSLSGFGSTGPWSALRSYGPTIEAASSIEARTGYPGGEPLRLGHTLPDGVGGLVGALAALRGLRERETRGGAGGWFDVSQLEAYVAVSGEDLLHGSMTGDPLEPAGNRSRYGALQGVFPCAGDDEWIAIRLTDRTDLERIAGVLDESRLAAEPAPPAETAETLLASHTMHRDKLDLARCLQASGIEAFPVLKPPELVDDPQLRARAFIIQVLHGTGHVYLPGSPLHGLVDPTRPAPGFGAHTEQVLAELEGSA